MKLWRYLLLAMLMAGCTGSSEEVIKTTQPPLETVVTTLPPETEAPPPVTTEAPEPISTKPKKTFETPLEITTSDVTWECGDLKISGHLATPDLPGVYPAIILAHGTEGYKGHHEKYAQDLAKQGYVSLSMCWFGCPGGRNTLEEMSLDDVSCTMDYLKTIESTDESRFGIIGFSRGASVALLSGSKLEGFNAVVSYYGTSVITARLDQLKKENGGRISYGLGGIDGEVLIIQGDADTLVDVQHASDLQLKLNMEGIKNEKVIYPDTEHAFNWEDAKCGLCAPSGLYPYNPEAADDAFSRTVDFLDRINWEE